MMKKVGVYYFCHIAINITLLIALDTYIELHILSLLSVFLIVLMLIQTMLFNANTKTDTIGDTAYSIGDTVRLTEKEQASQYSYLKYSFLLCIPFELPPIFFLSSYWKLIGVLPYVLAYIIGGTVFKIRNGKEIKDRISREKRELDEQLRKEEMGF